MVRRDFAGVLLGCAHLCPPRKRRAPSGAGSSMPSRCHASPSNRAHRTRRRLAHTPGRLTRPTPPGSRNRRGCAEAGAPQDLRTRCGAGARRLGARWPALRSRLGGAAAADCRCALARHHPRTRAGPCSRAGPHSMRWRPSRARWPRACVLATAPTHLCAGPRRTGVDALVRAVHYNVQDLANIAGVGRPEWRNLSC